MIGIFSFFAGAGFLDLGFELTHHFETMFVNEFNPEFNRIYRFARGNMGIKPPKYGHHVGDINKWLMDKKYNRQLHGFIKSALSCDNIDMVGFIGGPPCPDFSVAGKNRGCDGDNGKLSKSYVDLICDCKPDFFVFENVKGLYRTARHRKFFEELKEQLLNAGYMMTEQLINAIEFGAPQDRDRIILVGFHKRNCKNLRLKQDENGLVGFDWDSNKLYTRDVFNKDWPTTSPYQENVKTRMPSGIVKELTVEYWWRMNRVEQHPNANMYFKPRAGLHRFQTKDEGDDLKKCYKRLHRWRYSPTAAYGNNEVHIHPYKPRRISAAEALAIQSLPANFILPTDVTLSTAFKTIGNGVPFLAAKGVAQTIYDFMHRQ